ncbi:hypothetical protein X874_4500 [Mannheimia varigena USDA-ARS-USMARC-1312]|uniref:Uncharacterized protein n=1 Tax=Mannheimia varigena USDA-ARS-USMARC-1296 TaxID=1433287 RepID=W0QAV4_9PAST|nr:hypothetical protein [Mannheimia varigena]AHG74965.1 hypothetical protein X808_4420 [Mannheimia varigena USDA-ARS-USMARC-1296]AHG77086.1 hypothetical protein X874_4500 [Mannheimia varigena USDA-ARS-USMARC-1312]AHG80253.1 hypothetical protein X875_16350 [Mannheimia varigena USDA-ARS-USMARC-1388]MDY2947272.1 hypothetical protein [Mannheimia varigena]QLD32252.1 hypothetical protein A6B42_07460 [Mannheimia varigena]
MKRFTLIILSIFILGILFAVLGLGIFDNKDRCLDSGGQYDEVRKHCIK